jgi:predicted dehydrogenase
VHWQSIQAYVPKIKVTATVDIDPERAVAMAKVTGSRPFTTLEAALEQGNFAAVDIMLPHHLHEEAAVLAFEAGKHVVLEKPMAPTLESCDRIMAAANRAGTVFMVAEQSQYWLDVRKVQQLIQDGAIGDIITARAFFGEVVGIDSDWEPNSWRYDKAKMGGGICIDGGVHLIRPLRMWLGEVEEVVAVVGYPLAEVEGESLVRSLLRFRTGIVAAFDALARPIDLPITGETEEFRVTGTQGDLVIERSSSGRLILFDRDHPDGQVLLTRNEGRRASFGYELDDFARAVLEGKPLAAGPEYSLGDLRTALAIYRSAESRQWEKVWD